MPALHDPQNFVYSYADILFALKVLKNPTVKFLELISAITFLSSIFNCALLKMFKEYISAQRHWQHLGCGISSEKLAEMFLNTFHRYMTQ